MKIRNIIVGILTLGILNVFPVVRIFWINLLIWDYPKTMYIRIILP